MSLNPVTDDAPLPAAWTAAAAAVASLLGLWPCQVLYQDLWVKGGGTGVFVLAIYAPIAFIVVTTISMFPLMWLLRRQPDVRIRGAICLALVGIVLAIQGVPGPFGLGWLLFMTVAAYVDAARKLADGRDLRAFLSGDKKAVHMPPSEDPLGIWRAGDATPDHQTGHDTPRRTPLRTGALSAYDMPLWERLECESQVPLSATDGVEDGYRYTVLDLRHRGFGWRGDNGRTVVTTFFIVAIPESIRGRVITWRPQGWDVSVDADFVYMARPQKQSRPGEWRDLIQQAIQVVESLKTRESAGPAAGARTYRPRGDGGAFGLFNAVLFLAIGVLLVGYGLANMVGLLDYRTGCLRGSTKPRCLETAHGYSVPGALMDGGKYVLAGCFLVWGAHFTRARVRQRQRNDAHQQPDL